MKITIDDRNFKLNEHQTDFAMSKLERLDRYLPNIREVRLELSQQDNKRGEDYTIAQLTVMHNRGAILRTEEKAVGLGNEQLQQAVTAAVNKMHRRINRFKGKRIDRHRGRFAASKDELAIAEDIPDDELTNGEYAEADQETPPQVVRRKLIPLNAMNELEAIEQMELLGHTFFMFQDETTNKVGVMYKRSDGDYGVLLPE